MVGEWSKKAYLLSLLLYLPYKEGRVRLGREWMEGRGRERNREER